MPTLDKHHIELTQSMVSLDSKIHLFSYLYCLLLLAYDQWEFVVAVVELALLELRPAEPQSSVVEV